jgi:DNA-binding transcriptional MerR regulator
MSGYNIQVAANLTGVTAHTLRAWEKRYKAITPSRTDKGHREYSETEIKKIKALSDLCSLGHNISTIAGKNLDELEELLTKYGVQNSQNSDILVTSDPEKSKQALQHLMMAIHSDRLDILSHELYNLKMTLSPKDLALNVISPLMGEINMMIMNERISIAKEHAISSIIKFHLGKFIYQAYEGKRNNGELILITTPEGEYHEFGILLASLICIHHNKNIFYLGPNMPAEAIIEASESLEANKILLGTTEATYGQDPARLTNFLGEVLKGLNPKIDLVLGGPGYFDTVKFKNKNNFYFLPSLKHLESLLK